MNFPPPAEEVTPEMTKKTRKILNKRPLKTIQMCRDLILDLVVKKPGGFSSEEMILCMWGGNSVQHQSQAVRDDLRALRDLGLLHCTGERGNFRYFAVLRKENKTFIETFKDCEV